MRRWTPFAVTLLLAGCGEGAPRRAVIGYAFPPSGVDVVTAARAEIARHPVPGVEIELVYDSAVTGDPADVEVRRAERFAAIPGLVAVVGHGGSRGSLAASPVYNDARIPQIAPTSTSRLLRQAGPWTFMLAPDDSTEGALIGRFAARGLGLRRVSVFYINDEYGLGIRDGAVAELQRRGVTVLDEVPFGLQSDLATLVEASLRRGRPEALIVAGRPAATGEIARLARLRLPLLRIIAADGALLMPELATAAGPAADSIYVAAFWLPGDADSLGRVFTQGFQAATGRLPLSSAAMSRDAIMLVVEAIRAVGPDRAAIRQWLTQLGSRAPPFRGVTGTISLQPGSAPRMMMARLRSGRVERVPFE